MAPALSVVRHEYDRNRLVSSSRIVVQVPAVSVKRPKVRLATQ
jgi:hypothetical protein